MNFKDIRQAYFLGIGGIGMSAIARYFNSLGIRVSGYDKTATDLTRELEAEGIAVHYDDDTQHVIALDKSSCLVVLTPAIPKDHKEWSWLRDAGFSIMKRSQVLGVITDAFKTIGVAGTHGKTTTSTLVAHILRQSHLDCSAFLGGISTNYHSNLLIDKKKNGLMVVEADEFDRSFLTLHPAISIITSTDADHLDIYGEHDALKKSFTEFALQLREGGTLIIKKELELYEELREWHQDKKILGYSIKQEADVYADGIRVTKDRYLFDLHVEGRTLTDLYLGLPGLHNVENAVAASAATLAAGISDEELRSGLASFSGVKRRFEYIINNDAHIYIDDYAHHPEELRAAISSVKQLYPEQEITAIFQPHLFSRTRDFYEGFAESLSLADDVILLDIYPARELPIPGITSQIILDGMSINNRQLCSKEEALQFVAQKKPGILLTLGAGDIDQLVAPLKHILETAGKENTHGI